MTKTACELTSEEHSGVALETLSPSQRNVGLDLLRFIAVALVLGRHAAVEESSNWVLAAWRCGGWVGVDLFFVLSGFLVSSLLFNEHSRTGRIRVGRFLVRRGFKIYPAFWVFLGLTTLLQLYNGTPSPFVSLFVELLFLQNYFAGIWLHTWSLAVEEHFYFLLATLIGIATRKNWHKSWRVILGFILCVSVGCLTARMALAWNDPKFIASEHLFRTHLRIDSLFAGVMLAYLQRFSRLQQRIQMIPSLVLVTLGLTLLSPAFVFGLNDQRWISTVGLTLFYLGSSLLLLAAVRLKTSSSALLKNPCRLGIASYSIYLWHVPANDLALGMCDAWEFGQSGYWLMYIGGSLLAGLVMHHVVEVPALAIRERWIS